MRGSRRMSAHPISRRACPPGRLQVAAGSLQDEFHRSTLAWSASGLSPFRPHFRGATEPGSTGAATADGFVNQVRGFVMKVLARIVVIFASFIFASGLAVTTAEAKTVSGCPNGFSLMTVASLEATGHIPIPRQVDQAGNADGFVCALPLPDAVCPLSPCPVDVIYLYKDNKPAP